MKEIKNGPEYIFESSWEVCNKLGGIYTAISTKAKTIVEEYGDNYITIGPDVWKETSTNPFFVEDETLFAAWREEVAQTGLKVRIGRWTSASNALAILIDFTSLFTEKDKIFTHLWEKFGVDSLSGQWDYIEPTLFGYASGKVVESFTRRFTKASTKTVAHFHDWKSAAGVLYLKEQAQHISTVFTVHSSLLARAIASKNQNLYAELNSYNPDQVAHEMGLFSPFSLERAASREVDVFTAISKLASIECEHFLGRQVDFVTLNGFQKAFIGNSDEIETMRLSARKRLKDVAQGLLNQPVSDDTVFIGNSGSYEFRNKGIDLLIDSLKVLLEKGTLQRDVLVWIMVSGEQLGFRKSVKERIAKPDFSDPKSEYLTHSLFDKGSDEVLIKLKEVGIYNNPGDKIRVIFSPAFLNGADGIFDLTYYQLLTGMDLTVLPSYYEPWGYTPLESIAVKVPTISTSLSGFGQWICEIVSDCEQGICVVERRDDNYDQAKEDIAGMLSRFVDQDPKQYLEIRELAFKISEKGEWSNFIGIYYKAWEKALDKLSARFDHLVMKLHENAQFSQPTIISEEGPVWKKILVNPSVPKALSGLIALSKNLWWSWNYEAADLFEEMNPELFQKVEYNPIALIEALTASQWDALETNSGFKKRLAAVMDKFYTYMAAADDRPEKQVAYFSMEFGLHDTVKIYSGGLGMLAGDYLKEASDSNYNMIGIGLLYRYGYFTQRLTANGDQIAERHPQKFSHLPLQPVREKNGDWKMVAIALPGRQMKAKVWRLDVGRTPLYLLDSDIMENRDEDRQVTHQLYGGDLENRLKQELLLGVGGIRMIQSFETKPQVYHCNEGHAAFIGLERIRNLMLDQKLQFAHAKEVVRASTLFTTHTPVPAGHDAFSEDLLRMYIPHYASRLNIGWDEFMNLGRSIKNDSTQTFSMSVLALNLSQEVNGVSAIHGRVSREMFTGMYPGCFADEVPIGHVTNGVHFPTWTAKSWQKLYAEVFGEAYYTDQSNATYWKKIYDVDDQRIWDIRKKQKLQLIERIRERTVLSMQTRQANPKNVMQKLEKLDENALTIGFARRFATYKRANLLFSNLDRLSKIVNHPERPVQFIFAGKAHPHDKGGQDLIRRIFEISKMPEFAGKIFFLEGYDMEIAKYLIRGVDIWLNTPTRPLEASGTSGEKAVMNGVMNFSVLDGWWAEGYKPGAGWALKEERTFEDQNFQNELDAELIYALLEDEIAPMYYDHDGGEYSKAWIKQIKSTIAEVAPHFTMKRQLDDYISQYYTKLFDSSDAINANHYKKGKELYKWIQRVNELWSGIQMKSVSVPATTGPAISLVDEFTAQLVLDLNGLSKEDVNVEILFGNKSPNIVEKVDLIVELKPTDRPDNLTVYDCSLALPRAGVYDFVFRIMPKHGDLAYHQSMGLVKWI